MEIRVSPFSFVRLDSAMATARVTVDDFGGKRVDRGIYERTTRSAGHLHCTFRIMNISGFAFLPVFFLDLIFLIKHKL